MILMTGSEQGPKKNPKIAQEGSTKEIPGSVLEINRQIEELKIQKQTKLTIIQESSAGLKREEIDHIYQEIKRIERKIERLVYHQKAQDLERELQMLATIQKAPTEGSPLSNKPEDTVEREGDAPPTQEEMVSEVVRIDEIVEEVTQSIEKQNEETLESILGSSSNPNNKETQTKTRKSGEKWFSIGEKTKRKLKYILLPFSMAIAGALTQHSPREYYDMFKNWSERHVVGRRRDDPKINGLNILYSDSLANIERNTYDFIGKEKINYKSGYYSSSVFDLTDRTPPQFKLINDRENYSKVDSVAGITTNLFKKFKKFGDFIPELRGHLDKKTNGEIGEIPVIAYNTKTRTIKAGHYREFDDDWLVSETFEIPLNFQLDSAGNVALVYHKRAMRMVPQTINEKGVPIPFPIGVVVDKKVTKINPNEATHFGTLEGGKVIMVCGEKQLQVNGSFNDMFRVYERLQKEYPGEPIQAYLLDNGSFNLPIWNKSADSVITPQEIKEHISRNKDGGTALVLIANGTISPFEYRNKYKEYEHQIAGATLDSVTGEPAKNEHSVIVIHHTGNYGNPNQIIKEFSDTTLQRSAHVLILKDGTRHLFNNDNSVLGHAGKSDFNDRDKVNFFSLGVEMEGDTKNGQQFTIAQIESMLEYLRPRIEKYNISLNDITTHKIIRNNWLRKHPGGIDEKGNHIPEKQDLDDRVWKEIKDLISKKLYKYPDIKADSNAHRIIGALRYKESYLETGRKEYSLRQASTLLSEFGVPRLEIERTLDWIRENV